MRIVVISDTHGSFQPFWNIMERHKNDAGLVVFLGDGMREYEDIQSLYPHLQYRCVAGNCDFGSMEKKVDIVCVENKRILITHGDLFHVKASNEHLIQAARENRADIALFGHTHCAMSAYDDGLYLMNPGSPSCPRDSKASYGIIDLVQGGVAVNLVQL